MKDDRKTYRQERIEVNGTCVHFDGKYSPSANTLRVYRMFGDITLFDEAIQNFCIDNNIGVVVID